MHHKPNRRCLILCLILVAGLSCLSVQLIRIQVVDRKKYADSASNSYKAKRKQVHRRGFIIDRNDEMIAKDIPLKSVYIDKYQFRDPNAAAASLACKLMREAINAPAGEVLDIEECLKPLLTEKLLAEPHWQALKLSKRKSLVTAGARKLVEQYGVVEVKRRNTEYVIEELYRPLGVSKELLASCLDESSKRMHVLVKKELGWETMQAFEEFTKNNFIKGFEIEESVRREYVSPEQASHTVGVANHNRVGISGVEGMWHEWLVGRDGYQIFGKDVRGNILPWDAQTLPPKHGLDIRLTLDMRIQAIVEEELQAGMDYYDCKKGAIVVMDPHTGEVLAMASRPHYNLNNREDIVKNGFNYAIQASNETGSTIKIVATAGALNDGLVTYDTLIDCRGGPSPGYKDPDHKGVTVKDYKHFKWLKFWEVLQKSSNIGTYKMAKMLGTKRFYEYIDNFGYGAKSGIGLVGESSGRNGDTGNYVDFSRSSFGYNLTASPLQVTAAYCVIANGGKYIPPHIVKDVHGRNKTFYTGVESKRVKEGTRRVLKSSTASQMRRALLQVTTNKGTARRARAKGYIVGGKTGTNHKVEAMPLFKDVYDKAAKKMVKVPVMIKKKDKNGVEHYIQKKTVRYNRDKYITSFAGMCPAEDPNFVCVVVMDEPQRREVWGEKQNKLVKFKPGGGSVAAPIFSKLVKRIAPLRGVQPIFEESE